MKVSIVVAVILVTLSAILSFVRANPAPVPGGFFEKLFGLSGYHGGSSSSGGGYYDGYGGYNSGYRQAPSQGYSSGGSGRRQKQGRSYSDICRVVTIDAHARPGGRVYPAAPFCPYGG